MDKRKIYGEGKLVKFEDTELRTLSDDDVNPLMQKILAACEAECSATLRL